MRRFAIVLAAAAVVVVLIWMAGSAWMASSGADAAAEPWPAGLGPASAVPARYPRSVDSDAVRAISHLTVPEPLQRELSAYVKQEIERTTPDVAPLPPATAAFLTANAAAVDDLQRLATMTPIVWNTDLALGRKGPLPKLSDVLEAQRLLLARALAHHGDDAAWNDLHASWSLSRALLGRPELISGLVGLAIARNTNAVARTLPPPAPAWRREMLAFDYRRAFVATLQAEAWMSSDVIRNRLFDQESGGSSSPLRAFVGVITSPYRERSSSDLVRAEREAAAALYAAPQCLVPSGAYSHALRARLSRSNVFRPLALPALDSVWQRLGRFRIELEATTKLLQRDVSARSWCPDGQWIHDGATLRFSKEVSSGATGTTEMPLHFTVP
jgi:hypothetical protein